MITRRFLYLTKAKVICKGLGFGKVVNELLLHTRYSS
jgi:hypothetical protein